MLNVDKDASISQPLTEQDMANSAMSCIPQDSEDESEEFDEDYDKVEVFPTASEMRSAMATLRKELQRSDVDFQKLHSLGRMVKQVIGSTLKQLTLDRFFGK